jgi:hypothetical protein
VLVQPPDAGSVDVASVPAVPTARHSDAVGQATPYMPGIDVCVQLPAVGSVVVKTCCPSTATHSVVVGHVPELTRGVPELTCQSGRLT